MVHSDQRSQAVRTQRTQSCLSTADVLSHLRQNEFVNPYTFEEFEARQKTGKKQYFLRAQNPREEAVELYQNYLQSVQEKEALRAEERQMRI